LSAVFDLLGFIKRPKRERDLKHIPSAASFPRCRASFNEPAAIQHFSWRGRAKAT
jgi:hypothetical protein